MHISPILALEAWPIVCFVIFCLLPVRRAVMVSLLVACVVLSPLSLEIPGLPTYSRVVAGPLSALICVLIFDSARVLALRPRWYDLPVLVFTFGNVATSVANDLGVYDGLSSSFGAACLWCVTYYLGRAYFGESGSLKELALGFVLVGLPIIVPVLFESVFGPILHFKVYGVWIHGAMEARYGLGYRPWLFMNHALELAIFLVIVAILGYGLWATGTYRRIGPVSSGQAAAILSLNVLVTKSVGSSVLLGAAVLAMRHSLRRRVAWPLVLLIAVPPLYEAVRAGGVWSGENLVSASQSLFGADRAASLKTRLLNEDRLAAHAFRRPVFGWGGWGRSRIIDEKEGDRSLTDGYWVTVLASQGLVGMASLTAMVLLPAALFVRRCPARRWADPDVAAATAMSFAMAIFMIDSLSNAFPSPLYALIVGGLSAFVPSAAVARHGDAGRALAAGLALDAAGDLGAAEAYMDEAVRVYAAAVAETPEDPEAHDGLAAALAARAVLLDRTGRSDEALQHAEAACGLRAQLLASRPAEPARAHGLAVTLEHSARLHAGQGQTEAAAADWREAIALHEAVARALPDDPSAARALNDALNDLAWLLATQSPDHAGEAVELAGRAAAAAPDSAAYRNTLATAHAAAGDWAGAARALEGVARGDEGTAYDHFLLAAAFTHLDQRAAARRHYERGVAWMAANDPEHPVLRHLRDQAEGALSNALGLPTA